MSKTYFWKMGSHIVKIGLSLSLVGLLIACSGNSDGGGDTEQTLRIAVMYGAGNNDYYRQQWTELYEITHPKTKIEMLEAVDPNIFYTSETATQPDPIAEMKKLLTSATPPDVVIFDTPAELQKISDANLLSSLDTYMKKDNFDQKQYLPNVLESIKTISTDGKLYGLTPLFDTSVLFYNRTLFEEAGVEPPTDGLSWEDALNLAQQVSSGKGKNRIYGFAFNESAPTQLFDDAKEYATQLQLSFYDEEFKKMTVNQSEWEEVFNTLIEYRKSKIFPELTTDQTSGGAYDPAMANLFIGNKVAMMLGRTYLINQLIQHNETVQKTKQGKPIDWDIVSIPTFPESPETGGWIGTYGLMAINAKAQNPEGAWDFIRFINSKEWARLKSRNQDMISSLVEYAKPKEGLNYNVKAFYHLKPTGSNAWSQLDPTISYEKISEIESIGRSKIELVLEGKKKIKDALREWEKEGNVVLTRFQEEEKAKAKKKNSDVPEEPTDSAETP